MKWHVQLDVLNLKLGMIVSALVVGALTAGFAIAFDYYRRQLLDVTRDQAVLEAGLIRAGLEHGMVDKEPHLVEQMLDVYADRPFVQRVMILDRTGEVRVSSDAAMAGKHFSPSDPTCQVCHRFEPNARSTTVIVDLPEGESVRAVEPIANQTRCHLCHDPTHRMNGMLIVDVPLNPTHESVAKTMRQLAIGAGALCLALLGGIGFAFRRLVLRRLNRFRNTASAIANGQLERRVPVEGNDSLTDLEVQFNQMADSVVSLLDDLDAQRAHLENVMNSVDDGLVVLDDNRRIVAVNDAFRRRCRRDPIDAFCCQEAGEPSVGLCGREGGPTGCQVGICLETGEVELTVVTRSDADGATHFEEVRTSPVRTADGRISHVVEVWRDITDRRSAEARLAETQRMASLGMLASGFSHEVNTPLASIGTCLEAIERILATQGGDGERADRAEGEDAREYARIAREQVSRCGAITRQFLELARGRSLSRGAVDLAATVTQVSRLVMPTARQIGVSIEVADCDGLPSVVANAPSVQQVLLNLVLNAVEASEAGQTVRISGDETPAETVHVVIHDDGVGVPPESLSRVFEPFFTRGKQGTGLGLFVSLDLARRWGGDIRAQSGPDKGTTFTVVFPRPRLDDDENEREEGDDTRRR